MIPIGELRVGIPFAIAAGINPWVAYVVCVAANILIVPIVYLFLELIHHRMLHYNSYQSAFDKFMERTRKKAHPLVQKYGMLGLAIFVAIPIPGTGAYTGALFAWFLGMAKWNAFVSIAIGVAAAGAILLGILLGGIKLIGLAVL
jgi:uncharacterized membrane protein